MKILKCIRYVILHYDKYLYEQIKKNNINS